MYRAHQLVLLLQERVAEAASRYVSLDAATGAPADLPDALARNLKAPGTFI